MQTRQGGGKTLVVAGQAAEATDPRETPLDDPALGEQDKAVAARGALDHDQADAVRLRCGRRFRAGGGGSGIERLDRFSPSPPAPAAPRR
jgi:hypothetical protein